MPSPRLTIFFFPAWYPHRGDSMFGLFVKQHAIAAALLAKVGVVFAIGENREGGQVYEDVYTEEENVHTQRIYFKRSRLPVLGSLVNGYRYLRAVLLGYKKLVARIGLPQVNHVHVLTRAGIFPWLRKRIVGTPYVITEHWSRYLARNKGMYTGVVRRWLTKNIVKNASVVTTVSQNLAEAMQAHGLRNTHYRMIYNVADSRIFHPTTVKSEPKKIIHISCFEERSKNLTGMLRAVQKLSEKRNDFVFEMVGDGVDKPATEQLAESLGIKDTFVRFPGLKEGEELGALLREARFLLIFSHYENMPVVMNEAFMSGVPVLSSDVGGIREMLTPDKGVLVTPGDEAGLVTAMENMLDHTGNFDPQHIRAYAEATFSREALANYLDNLYREVLRS